MTIEQRYAPILEVRETESGGHEADLRIVTYGVRDSYGTSWDPQVFKRSVEEGSQPAVWAHESNRPIGVVTNFRDDGVHLDGTLEFLDFDAVPDARMAYTAMKGKAYRGVSFGFERRSEQNDTEIPDTVRITDADLIEISPVLRNSVPGSRVLAVRSQEPAYELRAVNGATEDPMAVLIELDKAVANGDIRGIETHLSNLEALVGMTPTFTVETRAAATVDPDEMQLATLARLEKLSRPFGQARTSLRADKEPYRAAEAKPYGDVTYADPGYQDDKVKRYPIDTKAHAKAAWTYVNQEKNASKYSSEELSKIKAKIKAALKKFGVDISE